MALTVNEGTMTDVFSDQVGGTEVPIVKLDVGAAGASSAFTGTLGAVTNIAAGSVKVTTGTVVSTGTVFAQTLGTEVNPTNEWTASGNLTGTATGTIKAAVSGSVIYVTSLIVSVESSGRVSIASGTPTSPIIGTMNFNANGGIMAAPLNPPLRTTSGSALVYNQSGTGVLGFWASGYVE
jgi:hypothetical protein